MFILFCSYIRINNKRIINTQYSQNLKYCAKKEEEESSILDTFNNIIDSLSNIMFSVGNIMNDYNTNYNNYNNYLQANRERENEFRENFPTAFLKRLSFKYNCNCFLFDLKIDMFDDNTIEQTPYNIRPLK